ncbi:uncharacterized protein LOC109806975 [Cajanus cajan]|uniref:uncharacterized protein LOC109806975 n=1 Tax=Cajanus cajan TaxID=3821 RepID=UPI00098D9D9B|nr:uncharacterized protein LOC109806975 [Cajanus cajan]
MNQRKYALELLAEAGLLGCKLAPTPIDNVKRVSFTIGEPFSDILAYRRLLGRLMCLTNTRPDITFSVHHLAQFLSKPSIAHYDAALRILHYVKNAPSLGLFFPSYSSLQLKAYSDSD